MPRAEAANLLHHVRDGADLRLEFLPAFFQNAQGFDHSEGADAIVKGTRDRQVTAQNIERVFKRHRITDAHQLLRFLFLTGPNVDEQLVNFGNLALFFEFREMRRHITNNAFDRPFAGVNEDALGFGDGGIHTPHLAHIKIAFVIDIVYGHGDFVGMAGQHQPR